MATVVDELVTKYTLDASGYKRGAGEVSAASKQASSSMGGDGKGFSSGIQASGVLSGLLGVLGTAMAAFAAEAGFAKSALDKFLEFDTSATIFAGAFGSLEKGKAVMSDLQDYAQKSAFQLDALTAATTRLVAGGLDIGRFLPLMEKFSLVANGLKPEGLLEVASAFLKMKGGSMGEAMETFRKAGISADDLRKQGVKIDKGGQIQSSSEEVFQALEKISGPGSRIAGIVNALSDSKATKFSNAMDAMDKAMVSFGSTIATYAMPYVEQFSSALNKMTTDGTLSVLADSFTNVVDTITGGMGVEQGLNTFASSLFTANAYAADFVTGIRTMTQYLAIFTPGLSAILTKTDEYVKSKQGEFNAARLSPEAVAYMKHLQDKKDGEKKKDATPAATDPIVAVSKNTSKMVELQKQTLDLHKMVFGSGAAAAGIAAEDLSDFRGRRSSTPRYHVNSTLQKIGVLLADFAHESQYAR